MFITYYCLTDCCWLQSCCWSPICFSQFHYKTRLMSPIRSEIKYCIYDMADSLNFGEILAKVHRIRSQKGDPVISVQTQWNRKYTSTCL